MHQEIKVIISNQLPFVSLLRTVRTTSPKYQDWYKTILIVVLMAKGTPDLENSCEYIR